MSRHVPAAGDVNDSSAPDRKQHRTAPAIVASARDHPVEVDHADEPTIDGRSDQISRQSRVREGITTALNRTDSRTRTSPSHSRAQSLSIESRKAEAFISRFQPEIVRDTRLSDEHVFRILWHADQNRTIVFAQVDRSNAC